MRYNELKPGSCLIVLDAHHASSKEIWLIAANNGDGCITWLELQSGKLYVDKEEYAGNAMQVDVDFFEVLEP